MPVRAVRPAGSAGPYDLLPVRTHNTTGKIQELRQEVRSGQYQISPRETAARMLLLEAEE